MKTCLDIQTAFHLAQQPEALVIDAEGKPRCIPPLPKVFQEALEAAWPHGEIVVSVTPRQIRLALIDVGVMPEAITASLTAIPDAKARAKALAEWEFAGSISRAHPLIAGLGASLKMSDDAIDALFLSAATQ